MGDVDQAVFLGVQNQQRVRVTCQLGLMIEVPCDFSPHISFVEASRIEVGVGQKPF